MNFRSVQDLNEAIVRGLSLVPRDVDLVVGIPRSGLLAAGMLALHLNVPMTDLRGLIEGRIIESGPRLGRRDKRDSGAGPGRYRHALVIDDSVLGGSTMQDARRQVGEADLDCRVTYAAAYVSPAARTDVDLFLEEIVGPRVFEWNLMHGGMIGQSCVDVDGVLCVDPTERQNDDGPRYRDFLVNARPLLVPTAPVGWLVTCRLEKYRDLTQQWLDGHGVRHGGLYMMDYPSKAARLAAGMHAVFKAEVYRDTGAMLFVESSLRQAIAIAQRAGRPVLCLETREMIYPSLAAQAPVLVSKAPSLARIWARRLKRGLRRRLLDFDPTPGVNA
jgi:uncharacterized HAD superfamily protein/adenine/guanine phosphoribosyltransferase-like PRPP-binding protein